MNVRVLIYACFMLIGAFISSVAQVMLKKESNNQHDSVIKEYLNPRVIVAYTIFFASTLLCIFAYRVIPLSMGAILEATGYIWVTIFGVMIFKEKLNRQKIIALLLIVGGIAVYSLLG